MRKLTTLLRKLCLLTACLTCTFVFANATTYTAILSGNFNSTLTWAGGIVPGALLSTDAIVIPSGITVTLTSTESFSGTSSLTVNGTLNSTGTGTALIMTSGSLIGSGSIAVDSVVLGLTSGLTYTGSIAARELTSLGAGLSTAASVTVHHGLHLASGVLSLTSGSLTMGSHSWITLSGGSLTTGGTGAVMLDSAYSVLYTSTSTVSGLELHGSGLDSVTVDVPGSVTLTSNDTVNGTLTLLAGTLALSGHTLVFGSAGSLAATGSGNLMGSTSSNIIINTSGGLGGSLTFASGGNMLNGLTLNSGSSSGTVTLGSDLGIDGALTLSSGTLSLNGHTLALNSGSTFSGLTSGSLTGSSSSNLIINTSGSLGGSLNFAAGGNTLNNLTINMGSSSDTVNLGSNLTLDGTLNLQTGKITLGNNNLTISTGGMLTGGSSGSYIVTNGMGSLVMNLVASGSDTFKVGTLANFSPMVVTAGGGSASGDVSVSVMSGVLSGGTTGSLLSATRSMVNATWMVASTATSGINYSLTAMWNAGMEVNSFDRSSSFISHFHGGVWDTTSTSAAGTMGSLYTQTRTGITSLSPFTVADNHTFTTSLANVNGVNGLIDLYPNPATNTLNYTTAAEVTNVSVYNMLGNCVLSCSGVTNSIGIQTLPTGTYMVRFTGNNVNEMKKFVKE